MRSIVISSGHGLKVRGASGYLDEVNEARKVVDRVHSHLTGSGCEVKKFHDDTSTTVNQNLSTIVEFHNRQTRDLDVSVHFNAYQSTTKPMGVEVLWVTQQELAGNMSIAIAEAGGFINRGAKKRTDLYFLNKTNKPSILIETCFCDSRADADLYDQQFNEICRVVAEVSADISLTFPVIPRPPVIEPSPPALDAWVLGIETTVFGGKDDPNNSAYPPYEAITDDVFGCAFPWNFPDARPQFLVRNVANGRYVVVDVVDKGPWMIDDNYAAIEQRPIAEQCYLANRPLPSGPNAGKVPTNMAGLDLTPAAAKAIGLSGKGVCDWIELK